MRLIDADALKTNIEQSGGEGTIARYCKRVLAECLDNDSPTIDAIPVEWLKNRREGLIFAAMTSSPVYGDNSIELCHAVNVVLNMWQKEQKAR